jgi:hypothetical protein
VLKIIIAVEKVKCKEKEAFLLTQCIFCPAGRIVFDVGFNCQILFFSQNNVFIIIPLPNGNAWRLAKLINLLDDRRFKPGQDCSNSIGFGPIGIKDRVGGVRGDTADRL